MEGEWPIEINKKTVRAHVANRDLKRVKFSFRDRERVSIRPLFSLCKHFNKFDI